MHSSLQKNVGKLGVLLSIETSKSKNEISDFGKQLAMHIAATKPMAISRDDLDASVVERERSVLSEQARESGKPEEIIEKMVEGRLRKFFEEVCLIDQTFVIDGETRISQVLEKASKDLGKPVSLAGFKLLVLGEGVEKKEEDFAAEVAAVTGT